MTDVTESLRVPIHHVAINNGQRVAVIIRTPIALAALGYRTISSRYGTAARIDREDWLDHMCEHHGHRLFTDERVDSEDFYRRCHSEDRMTVPPQWRKQLKNSRHSKTGFIDLRKMEGIFK